MRLLGLTPHPRFDRIGFFRLCGLGSREGSLSLQPLALHAGKRFVDIHRSFPSLRSRVSSIARQLGLSRVKAAISSRSCGVESSVSRH
jgi:hypothetical protein